MVHSETVHSQVDLGIGGTVCFNQWDPAWRKGKIKVRSVNYKGTQVVDHYQNIADFKPVWMPLYGPVISLTLFRRVRISSIFIYGTTVFRSTGIGDNLALNYGLMNATVSTGYRRYKRETIKMDSDTTVGVNVTDYLFIYAGYKYQSYSYKETSQSLHNFTDVMASTPRRKYNYNHGAGLGIGFNIHLYNELYLQLGVAGILMAGHEKSSKNYVANFSASTASIFMNKNGNYLAYGGTFVPVLAYRTPVNIALYLGFKGQLLRYRQLRDHEAYELFNKQMDFFYGITFSVVYIISFEGKKIEKT